MERIKRKKERKEVLILANIEFLYQIQHMQNAVVVSLIEVCGVDPHRPKFVVEIYWKMTPFTSKIAN